MTSRVQDLAARRRMLVARSDALRADLAADGRVLQGALGGIERALFTAKRLASPLLLIGAGAFMLKFIGRRGRRGRRAKAAIRGLAWVSLARRILPLVGLARAFFRGRRGRALISQQPHDQ